MKENFDFEPGFLNKRFVVKKHEATIYINIPKQYAKMIGITGKDNEEIEMVPHAIYKNGKKFNLCKLSY
jgi:hypothetical protein